MPARFLPPLLLGLALASCSTNDLAGPGEPCGTNKPCVSGYICEPRSNVCVLGGTSGDAPTAPDAPAAADARAADARADGATADAAPPADGATRDAAPDAAAPDAAPDAPPPTPIVTISSPLMDAFTSTQVTLTWTSTVSVPGFECKIDAGAFARCGSGLGGSLDLGPIMLAGGPHAASVRAVDADDVPLGVPAVVTWTIDTSGPTFIIDTITSAPNSGTVVVTYRADKATQSQSCRLDGVLCETCTDATSSCGEASPGFHVFTISGVDTSGNPGGATTSKPVLVSYGPFEGHAILIGMDYRIPNAKSNQILHRAFEQVPWRHQGIFDRKLRVAAFRQDTVDTSEATNARAAVEDLVDDAFYDEFTNSTEIAAALVGHDVLLVYDQEDPTNMGAVGDAWEPTLRTFLEAGGIVVVLDGLAADNTSPSGTFQVLSRPVGGDPALLLVEDVADIHAIGQSSLFAFADDIGFVTTEGDSPLQVVPAFNAPNSTVVYLVTDPEEPRAVQGASFTPAEGEPLLVPTVIDKIFPVYNISAAVPQAVGPSADVAFTLDPLTTPFDHVDCVVKNLSCAPGAAVAGCVCGGSLIACACDGDDRSGFSIPFVASGTYQLTMRVIDTFGRPGRGSVAQFAIDLPAVSATAPVTGFSSAVFCFHASTVDNRLLTLKLSFDGAAVVRDAVKDASCAANDTGSFTVNTCEVASHVFRVDATDSVGNTGAGEAAWNQQCIP